VPWHLTSSIHRSSPQPFSAHPFGEFDVAVRNWSTFTDSPWWTPATTISDEIYIDKDIYLMRYISLGHMTDPNNWI
jgi:hypothetical protein